jgi:type I protein arginine methyltransferase
MDLIKLVNYIRSNVKAGNLNPDVSSKALFEADKYLQPVLEDDALLYTIEDALEPEVQSNHASPTATLEAEVASLRAQLTELQSQFSAYRTDVQRTMMANLKLTDGDIDEQPSTSQVPPSASNPHDTSLRRLAGTDDGYFSSYAHPSIHHTMLSDTIRTDAYRDFIYDNKQLFAGKTVLDVGCGTGILSMFCAKAGAKQVIAVDNSDIIDKAIENVFRSGLDGQVRCLRGKIEELDLGLGADGKVDVIVSEWMGYCLLYESMLDSVIYARDRYLKEDGLMVPSHATLKIAPLVDSDIRIEKIDFWKDVYGFDMSGMLEHAYDEALAQSVKQQEIMGDGNLFRELDLHQVSVSDLSFEKPWDVAWNRDGNLEGFVIWFDIFFATNKHEEITFDVPRYGKSSEGAKAFTTGPFGKDTHWYQGILLLKDIVPDVKVNSTLKGSIAYQKAGEEERGLDITVAWTLDGKEHKQVWKVE